MILQLGLRIHPCNTTVCYVDLRSYFFSVHNIHFNLSIPRITFTVYPETDVLSVAPGIPNHLSSYVQNYHDIEINNSLL